ncbi:RHS repeat-associated core domain-containing protein [Vibrio navarrensis]
MESTQLLLNRRGFLKQTGHISSLALTTNILSPLTYASLKTKSALTESNKLLVPNKMGFNGKRQDPVTQLYSLGHGYRAYNPTLMRFHANDSQSPFGKGGHNGYAYCLGDPVNRHDPSGHFALLSLIIGAIVGAIVGAATSAVAEGIQCAINPEHKFDWKQVGIGAAVGFITGGVGIAAAAPKAASQLGLAVVKAATTEFASVPISTVAALSQQPNASKGLQIAGKVLNGVFSILGLAYGAQNVAKIGKVISKRRVVSSFRRKNFASYNVTKGDFDTHKSLSHDQVVLRGISSLSSIASTTSSLVAATQTELGMNAEKSNLASKILHFTGAATGYLGSQSLKVSQQFKADPIAFSASRFSDFSHLAGLIGLLATEPGSDEESFFNTLTLLFKVNSTGTLKVQNHLKER